MEQSLTSKQQFWRDHLLAAQRDQLTYAEQTNREWQPTAIADAIQISRLLKDLIWRINEGLVQSNKAG